MLNETKLKELHKRGWKQEADKVPKISKDFTFKDFKQAFAFLTKIAEEAEKQNHHPEIYNVYNKVTLTLTTHDSGELTEKDYQLAETIDYCLEQIGFSKSRDVFV